MSGICDERPVECGNPACVCHEFSARMPSESLAVTEGAAGFLEPEPKNVSQGAVGSGIGISDDADLRQRARISRAIDNWIVEENAKRGRETVFPLEHPPLRSLAEAAAYNDGYRAGQIDALEKFNEDLREVLRVARERIER